MKKFLNDFLSANRNIAESQAAAWTELFEGAVQALADAGARAVIRRPGQRINAAFVEAVVVAVMKAAADGTLLDPAELAPELSGLIANPEMVAATAGATSNEESLKTRLELAASAFRGSD